MLKNFLIDFLKRGDVSDEWLDTLTKAENMRNFKIATTHESKDSVNNYEQLEFFGDTILNNSIVWWIKSRHPHIVNVEWLTKIKHLFVGTRIVSKLGQLSGIEKIIDYDKTIFPINSIEKSNEFAKIVEDVFESLLGAICQTFVDLGLEHGVGIQVCQNIVWSLLDELNYPITYESIWDPPVIIKEMYDVTRWIFVWNESNIPGVKEEKNIELRWWNSVSANSCTIRDPQKRAAYINLFMNYHDAKSPDQTFKLDKQFVLTVESFEFNLPIGKANRLPVHLFRQYFGEGEVLVGMKCLGENEKSCKIELAKKGIEIMKKNGYTYNRPPPFERNVHKTLPNRSIPASQPFANAANARVSVSAPSRNAPLQPYKPSPFPALDSQNINTMTQFFDWDKKQVYKNTKLYNDVIYEARKKGWIGYR